MRFYILCFICAISLLLPCRMLAQVNSEDVLVSRILMYLQREDDSGYATLFPQYEELIKVAASYNPTTPEDQQRINNILGNPRLLLRFDPAYNTGIISDFRMVIAKGTDSGLHWRDIMLAKFELQKMRLEKDMVGFEKIATLRLGGFVHIRDMLTRRVYMMAVTDVLQVNGKWYGGKVINIQEASTEEEYNHKLDGERQLINAVIEGGPEFLDSLKQAAKKYREEQIAAERAKQEDKNQIHTRVVARKFYEGKYDNRIPVQLYIRYMEGGCPEGVCSWEAMYRMGNMEYFVLLDVSKSPEGIWSLVEEDMGVMELELSGPRYRGKWISFTDQTEYVVRLDEQEGLGKRKVKKLDKSIESLFPVPD